MELENSERLGDSLESSETNAHEVSAQAREAREKFLQKTGCQIFLAPFFAGVYGVNKD